MTRTRRSTVHRVKILITGAAGLIGTHFARRLSADHQVIALTRGDLDITDAGRIHACISAERPSLIVNCAVVQVDDAERDPAKAAAVNADGPRLLAVAAAAAGAQIIQLSTQYAFDGEPVGRAPYTIDDEPRPVNVYGQTKVAGEHAVRRACSSSYIVRTSWVYGSGKDSFLCTVHLDLKSGRRVRAIDDIWSSTTYVEDLVERCLQVVQTGRHGTYHVVNAGVCSYYEFALHAAQLIGLERERLDELIEVVHERDMRRAAARPRYTPMRCLLSEKLGLVPMRRWQDALAEHVASSALRR